MIKMTTSIVHRQTAVIATVFALLALNAAALPLVSPSPAIDGLIDEATLARALAASSVNSRDSTPVFSTLGSRSSPPSPTASALTLSPPQFPWPYPPQFEAYLPYMAKRTLLAIYIDITLSPEERSRKVNEVFDSLPLEISSRLPLPDGYERLPADVYARIAYVHSAPGFRWSERQALIHQIVESLPSEQRRAMGTRLEGPPPGFELVLAPSVYKQLLAIHYNQRLGKTIKSELITRVMRQVPQSQIDRLPMPAGMQTLPTEVRSRLHTLVYDYSVPQPERARRVHAFVASLPAEYRPPL